VSASDPGGARLAVFYFFNPSMFRATLEIAAAMGALRGRDQGLDLDEVLPAARKLIGEQPRTFGEIRSLLLERFPEVNERALGYATRLHLPLAMVPTDDAWAFPRDSVFALADVGATARAEDLVKRYLGAFGPASAADFQAWSGLKGAKDIFDAIEGLVTFRLGRRTLYDLPDAPRPDPETPAPPRLLPDFDSLLLAHQDRTRIVADEHRKQLVTKNLRIKAVLMVDGRVAGTWAVEKRKVELSPFGKLAKADRAALADEAEALLAFSAG
jgi:hypothetical protein